MSMSKLMNRSAMGLVLSAGLILTGCNQTPSANQAPPPQAALPLTTAAAPPIVQAPPASQLPAAPRPRIARVVNPRDRYAYADQANAMSYGMGDAPPDYTFDYNGARPWVWRSDDDAVRVVEPVGDGDRYYYYQPGQDYPYLVRDADYAYGFDNGALVVIYDRDGRVMPPDFIERRADYAGRYLYRGRDLYDAARQRPREAVAASNWAARSVVLAGELALWASLQNRTPDWRDYHAEHEDQQRAAWDQERYRRQAEAARTYQMMNDQQASQRAWQAAQQAQIDARAHGQSVGPTPVAGFIPQIFRRQPPQQAQTPPAPGQGFVPGGPQRPGFGQGQSQQATPTIGQPLRGQPGSAPNFQGQPIQGPTAQARPPIGQPLFGQPGFPGRGPDGRPVSSPAQAQVQAQDQARIQAQAQAEAAHRAAADQARQQAAEQARLAGEQSRRQAAEQARLQAAGQARLQAADQARLQAAQQARLQAEQQARLQAAQQARLQAEQQTRLQAAAQARQQARTEAEAQAHQQAQSAAAQAEAARRAADQARLQAAHQAAQGQVKPAAPATDKAKPAPDSKPPADHDPRRRDIPN